MNFVSIKNIEEDLRALIEFSNIKVSKRVARLKTLYKIIGLNPEDVESFPTAKELKADSVDIGELNGFLNAPAPSFQKSIQLEKDQTIKLMKQTLEALLTAKLNSNLKIYEVSYNIFVRLLKRIENDHRFGPLFLQKKLIPVCKGGIAARLVLLAKYPNFAADIEKSFGLGGDNDCMLLLDPTLENFEDIHQSLTVFVQEFLFQIAGPFAQGIVKQQADKIKSISVDDTVIDVSSCERHAFTIVDGNMMHQHEDQFKGIFTTRNDTLDFNNTDGSRCKFSLIRLKKAFKIGQKVLGAEILDISIPHNLDNHHRDNFARYQSGEFIQKGKLLNGKLQLL